MEAAEGRRRLQIPAAIAVAFLLFYLSNLGAASFWFDEIDAVYFARLNFSDYWGYIASSPTNAPLHFLLMWCAARLGAASEWAFRLPSALFAAAAVFFLFRYVEDLAGREAAVPAALAFGLSAPVRLLAQEARGYSLFLLFSGMAFYFARRLARNPGRNASIAFAVAGLGGLLSHFFMAFPLMGLSVHAIGSWMAQDRKGSGVSETAGKGRRWFFLCLGAVLLLIGTLYVPRFFFIPASVANIRIPPAPDLSLARFWAAAGDLAAYDLRRGDGIESAGIAACLLLAVSGAVVRASRREREFAAPFLHLAWLVLTAIVFLHFRGNFYSARYLTSALVPFYALVGAGFAEVRREGGIFLCGRMERLSHAAGSRMALMAAALGLFVPLTASAFKDWGLQRQDWRSAVRRIVEQARPGDALILEGLAIPSVAWHLQIPVSEMKILARDKAASPIAPWELDYTTPQGLRVTGSMRPEKLQQALEASPDAWCVTQRQTPEMPAFKKTKAWLKAHMRTAAVYPGRFSDVLVGRSKTRSPLPGEWNIPEG